MEEVGVAAYVLLHDLRDGRSIFRLNGVVRSLLCASSTLT
jgi:hypothetical protein